MPIDPVFADKVRTFTTTTGTGAITPGAAVDGHQSFADALTTGDSFYYSIEGVTVATEWEVGSGTLQSDGTITRDPLASSNGGALVNFSAGTKTIALTASAEWFNAVDEIVQGDAELAVTGLDVEGEIVSTGPARTFLQVRLDENVSGEEFNYNIFQTDFSSGGRAPDDTVVQWGWNAGQADRADATKPACYWQMERRYSNQAGDPNVVPQAFEVFIQTVGTDNAVFRPFFFYIPRDGQVNNVAYATIATDRINWYKHSAIGAFEQVAYWDFRGNSGEWFTPFFQLFRVNNYAPFRQLNAAGTTVLSLPYYNGQDVITNPGPTYIVGAAKEPATGVGAALLTLNCTSIAVDQPIERVLGPAVTGRYFTRIAQGAATTQLIDQLYNSAGSAVRELQVLASGDAMDTAAMIGGTSPASWSWGVRRTGGCHWRVVPTGRSLSATAAIDIDPVTLKTVFGGPTVAPIEVVAESGTAVTLGAEDAGTRQRLTAAGAVAVTVPADASAAMPVGTRIQLEQAGAGVVTVAPASGVTLSSRSGLRRLLGQNAVAELVKIAANQWTLSGDLGTPSSPLLLQPAVWYDPSDLSSLSQNSDGTGAVAVGDPVGRIMDKSGNGRHAIQATAGSRPVLRQDSNGYHYLEFDGADDELVASWSPTAYPITLAVAGRFTTSVAGGLVSLNQGLYQYKAIGDNSSTTVMVAIDRNATNVTAGRTVSATANNVMVGDYTATSLSAQVNLGTPTSTANTNAFGAPNMLRMGAIRAGGPFTGGRVYGLLAFANSLTGQARNDAIYYLASVSGVTV